MSIFGCRLWNDRKTAFFDQTNNPTEHVLHCLLPKDCSPLETCGPTAAVNCQASMGRDVVIRTPGGYRPQPEEVLSDWFNDARNFWRMLDVWPGLDPGDLPGNEVVEWYPLAVKEVFGNACEIVENITFDGTVAALRAGRAVQVCLERPGHFIALVAFDDETREFVLKDSWGGRWPDGDGFCKRLAVSEFQNNVKPKGLIYS